MAFRGEHEGEGGQETREEISTSLRNLLFRVCVCVGGFGGSVCVNIMFFDRAAWRTRNRPARSWSWSWGLLAGRGGEEKPDDGNCLRAQKPPRVVGSRRRTRCCRSIRADGVAKGRGEGGSAGKGRSTPTCWMRHERERYGVMAFYECCTRDDEGPSSLKKAKREGGEGAGGLR